MSEYTLSTPPLRRLSRILAQTCASLWTLRVRVRMVYAPPACRQRAAGTMDPWIQEVKSKVRGSGVDSCVRA